MQGKAYGEFRQESDGSGGNVDVVVIGGGPVGLAMSVLLERFGVSHVVIERAAGTTDHPKARGTWPRTMELFRQWGIEDAVRRRGLAADADSFAFVESMAGHEYGRTRPEADIGQTPSWKCICSQDVVEEELLVLAKRSRHGRVLYDMEFVSLEEGPAGVIANVRATRTGQVAAWRGKYLIGADGAGSRVRRQVGIEVRGPATLAVMANDYWAADLSGIPRTNHTAAYRVYPEGRVCPEATILNTNGKDRWLTNLPINGATEDTRSAPWSEEEVVRHARIYTGVPNLEVKLINRSIWRLSRQVAETFSKERVFLVGDSAHRFPPNGGFGMNSGIQDAHNLAWKLKFVLAGEAGPDLLQTYDLERRPVAESNANFSYGNSLRYRAAEAAFASRNVDQMNFWIRDSENHVHSAGQGLGFSYDEGALIPDRTIKTPLNPRYYVPSDRPGGRFPHMWLDLALQKSTLDWFDKDFVVVAGPQATAWAAAAQQVSNKIGLRIAVHHIESPDERDGLHMGQRGMVLVRPDGHVAFRMPWTPSDPTAELANAINLILRRSGTEGDYR